MAPEFGKTEIQETKRVARNVEENMATIKEKNPEQDLTSDEDGVNLGNNETARPSSFVNNFLMPPATRSKSQIIYECRRCGLSQSS